ncbi:Txe/YoeB family addiction module toxin [Corynebacterium sp. YSMAA1_1_D6]|uniref:Txe/YoeB family addiction module toxin n=1 Tax=unclassified Corynebacterium TaxID=2624378 RepID=UPI0027BB1864|nr:Txe/YoeB family addiction module toxin [Corynebacterium sp.]
MLLSWTPHAGEDYLYWQRKDRKVLKRVNQLLKDMMRDPFEGIGKPEPLKYGIPNAWSRRITDEHRIVYLVEDNELRILQARYHY